MTRLVTAMEQDGLVQRLPSAQDGRKVFVRITDTGRNVLESGQDRRVAALVDWLKPIGANGLGLWTMRPCCSSRSFGTRPSERGGGPARGWLARPEPAVSWPTWLALLIAAALLTGTGTPPVTVVACLLAVTATLLVSLRWHIPHIALLVLLDLVGWRFGGQQRAAWAPRAHVTQAAIRTMLDGSNPYGVGIRQSIPPGAPFAYGPLALLWYLPSLAAPGGRELLLSDGRRAVLAIRGRPLGLALFATLRGTAVTATTDRTTRARGCCCSSRSSRPSGRRPGRRATGRGGAVQALRPRLVVPLLAYGGIPLPLLAFVVTSLAGWGMAASSGAGPSSTVCDAPIPCIHRRTTRSHGWCRTSTSCPRAPGP